MTAVHPETLLAIQKQLKKQVVQTEEERLCDIKAKAAARDSAAQAELDDLRARLSSSSIELDAKVKSAEKAMKQAENDYNLCVIQRNERKFLGMRAISAVEEERQKTRSEADAEIQESEKLLGRLRQQIMALESSSSGQDA